MPILASNFASNSLSGTTRVVNGFANITLSTIPYALEGDKSFVIKIRKDSITGEVFSTSPVLTFRDSSSIVSLTANISSVAEGNLVAFTLVTANTVNGANLFYSVFPVTANVTAGDFTANTGTFTITNNAATFALKANADLSLSNEDGETFRVQLRTNDSVGNVVFVSSNVVILDTYKTYNVLSFVENSSPTIVEGTSVTFTFTATNIPNGTILHYSTSGNTTSFTSNTGSFVMNGTSNTFVITNPQVPYNVTRVYSAIVRDGSAQGAILATSNTINVIDETLVPLSASGGVQSNISGHRIHIFTTSGNIAFNKIGVVEYLVIAGGGGGAYGGGTNTCGGGGGGAGGFLNKTSTELVSSTVSVIVGAAGTAGSYNAPAPNGSPSSFNADTAIGGGGGGGQQNAGGGGQGAGNGGSGGGAMYGSAPGGNGTPGQGNPGGSEHPSVLRNSGGGGGAGGQGSPASTTNGGIGLTANSNFNLPASYGTTGPAPGRYFAGGGGGGYSEAPGQSTTGHLGGAGGGGNGRGASLSAGETNTGGGGGGGGGSSAGAGGGSGIVIIKYSTNVTIPTFNVTTSTNSIVEGNNIVVTLNTINLSNNTLLYYYTVGNVISSDFVTGNTGSFRTTENSTTITLQSNTNIPLNQERFLQLKIAGDAGTDATPLATSNIFTITDGILTYNITTSSNFIYEGANAVFALNTTYVPNNTLLYYYTVGNLLTSNFVTGNTGSFRTTQNSTTIRLQSNTNIPANEERFLQLKIAGSAGTDATPLATSNVFTIKDSNLAPLSGEGGTLITENGYNTHIFTTSGNITFSKTGTIEYLIVAGGGGGAYGGGTNTCGGGGGGAGGLLFSNNISVAGTTMSVVVGAAGTAGSYNAPAPNGSPSSFNANTAIGGGGGGGQQNAGAGGQGAGNGGSGGGAMYGSAPGGGGTAGQGNPGGSEHGYYLRNSGGGGGAGARGGVNPSVPSNTNGGDGLPTNLGLPSSYGTSGPAPGRYFAGGGAGGRSQAPNQDPLGHTGGAGGGGNGHLGGGSGATAGTTNTGGGGGGGGGSSIGTAGGSGVVIIRYPV